MSSISQEDSMEAVDPRKSFDQHQQRKSNNPHESYDQRSYSGHKDNSKFQNSSYSSSYERSDAAQTYLNGSPNQDDSADFTQEDSKMTKDNYRNTSELEAVPETSVEHSEMTHKLSHNLDSDIHRWVNEHEPDDIRNNKALSHFQKSAKDQYEQNQHEINGQGHPVNERNGIANFISPRFQMQSSEKKGDDNSREFDNRSVPERDDYYRKTSQNNYETLYNDTFNRKAFDQKITEEKAASGQESFQGRGSSPSESSYPQKLKKYMERDSHKISPKSRRNLSALDFAGEERGSEKYSTKRLNKTDVAIPQSIEDSFQGNDYSDITRIVQFERERNEILEEKVHQKKELLKQMKKFHDELYQDNLETKNELERVNEEREALLQEVTEHQRHNIKIIERNKELENRMRTLIEKNQCLMETVTQKDEVVSNLEDQLGSFEAKFEITYQKQEKKIESLNRTLNKYKKETRDSFNSRERLSVIEDEEKQVLRKNLDEVSLQLKNLSIKNEDLSHEIEVLRKQNYENERMLKDKYDDSFPGKDASRISHDDTTSYKRKIAKLKALNENLKLELNSRPTVRRFKENEMKINSLENELEDAKNGRQEQRKSSEINFTSKLLRDVICELEIENVGDILSRIQELQEHSKTNDKFVNSILELVERCSPGGYFEGRPTPKQAWRWIKRLMEEYMTIKKEGRDSEGSSDQEVLRVVMDYLMVDDIGEISIKLRNVLVESNLMKRVISKIKMIHNFERVTSLQDLERRLESIINFRTNESESRSRHY